MPTGCSMPTNTYRARCRFCGKMVAARAGRADKSATTGHWMVSHHKCYDKREPSAPAPPAYRPPYADD